METKRFILRGFTTNDFDDFAALIRDKMQNKYAPYDDQYPTDDASLRGILDYFSNPGEFFAVEEKRDKRVIGFVGLNRVTDDTRNLGYCVRSDYWNQGCATEAVGEIIAFAKREPGVRKLVSGTAKANIPSVRLLEKFGFRMTGEGSGHFANDPDGKPITFTGLEFELDI